ncbi:MAG: LD-carboxypeptidase [Bacillaceae bacterium]|nr:LD-carboxypeptidase [Bacillaceae bacterium]
MATKPLLLQTGDSIGLVSPGSPLDANIINARIETLRNMGFNIVFGKYLYSFDGITSTTPERRAEDLMFMFSSPGVKMILPSRGGTGVQSLLPFLDYNVIRQNPKIITGYSDITVLLNTLYQLSDLITFHSLMLPDFRSETPTYNFNQFFESVSTLTQPRVIQNPPNMPQISLVRGNVTGPIVGGNITSIMNTFATPYEIDTKGKVLFLEDINTPTNMIYRYFTQLSMAGKLEDCIGIVIGECTNCPVSYGTTLEMLINEWLVPLGKPLMVNVATGHGLYKASIPIGTNVNLNTNENRLTVLEATVRT